MRARRGEKRPKEQRSILCVMESQLTTCDKLLVLCIFFFFSAMASNGVDAMCFLCSALHNQNCDVLRQFHRLLLVWCQVINVIAINVVPLLTEVSVFVFMLCV